jgi:hypothetical protein
MSEVQAFLGAMRDAHKAWAGTSMLARVRESRAQHVCTTLAHSDAPEVADLISDMAGPSIATYAMTANIDGEKVMRLSALVTQMLLAPCVQQRDRCSAELSAGERAIALCNALRERLLAWIEAGGGQDAPGLEQVDELIGRAGPVRLGLVAALAPALVHCEIVARAIREGYPFARG